ncbi:LysR family transcriptional regulator [Bordetella sp. 2513F-2]
MNPGNITLKQLRAFVTVAQERSFTRASARLHVTQSTLTASIKILEDEIGMRLLDRSTRFVMLTAHGREFLPAAERMLRDLHESLETLRLGATRQRGSVIVAAAASFINYVLSPAVVQMAQQYPGIRVRMREETTEGVCRMVLSGEADFGITTLFQPVPEVDTALVLIDVYGAVFAPGHPLAAEQSTPMPWSRLAPHTMVALHPSNGIRALLDLHPGIPIQFKRAAYEVGTMPSLYPLLARGLGYAALPAMAARPLVAAGLRYVPLGKPALRRELYVVKPRARTLSPAAMAMLEAMTDALKGIAPDRQLKVVFGRRQLESFAR